MGPALLLVALLAPPALHPGPGPALASRDATRFTTDVQLTFVAGDTPDPQIDAAFAAILAEFDRIDALASEWRPDTPVAKLNAHAGEAVVVPDELYALLERTLGLCDVTHGGFDPTFKTLAGLWPLRDPAFRPPTQAQIDALLPAVGYRHLVLDPKARTARLTDPRTRVGLGGIAKGYAVERAVEILRGRGLQAFCLRVGGELYCAGDKHGTPWQVGVRDPRDPDRLVATLPIRDASFTTSGDYERFALVDGVRYHHIVDPRTAAPARGVRSVTILARNPTEADALSTGVFVLGVEAGMALLDALPAAEGVIVDDQGAIHTSRGLKAGIQEIK